MVAKLDKFFCFVASKQEKRVTICFFCQKNLDHFYDVCFNFLKQLILRKYHLIVIDYKFVVKNLYKLYPLTGFVFTCYTTKIIN